MLLFIGRFHVLLVHLPIGMLVLLATLEVLARFPRFKRADASAGFILALAAPITLLTAACGWLLSLGGGYPENLLEWHKWLGTATAAGCILSAILYQQRKITAYRISLFVTVAILTAAGHLGGSLTHGRDYLIRYAPAPLKNLLGLAVTPKATAVSASRNTSNLPVFSGVIAPLLANKCVTCHGPDKSKGGLRLDSFAAMQQGGDDGLIFDPDVPAQSELLRRILLPLDDDDHMPPQGKSQLTTNELALLKWWVETGTPVTNLVSELNPPPAVRAILNAQTSPK